MRRGGKIIAAVVTLVIMGMTAGVLGMQVQGVDPSGFDHLPRFTVLYLGNI